MSESLNDKVVVVTGGHSGIGYFITRHLIEAGARVAIFGRRQAVVSSAAEELGVLGVQADIGDPDSVRAAFARVDEALGPLDVLINNAAVFPIFKVAEATDAELNDTVATNVLGLLYCIREAARRMRGRGGDILSMSSESVMNPFPYLTVYAATKSAMETLSRGLKSELRADGIRVAVLRSGHVGVPDRQSGSNWDPERAQAFFAAAQASGHMTQVGEPIHPDTTAASVVHLLTQPREASIDFIEVRAS